jgi:hypothetical protein
MPMMFSQFKAILTNAYRDLWTVNILAVITPIIYHENINTFGDYLRTDRSILLPFLIDQFFEQLIYTLGIGRINGI